MKHSEMFAKEIFDLACNGAELCVKNGKPASCIDIKCNECDFGNYMICHRSRMFNEWCESEYEEPKITIPQGATVDTKILVSNDGKHWNRRYFAGFDGSLVVTWFDGQTSWSNNKGTSNWVYGKLATTEEE